MSSVEGVESYLVLHDESLLKAAEGMARQILDEQTKDGYYPRSGHRTWSGAADDTMGWPNALFGTLGLEALCAINDVRPHEDYRRSVFRQVDWFLDRGLLPARDGMNARARPDGARPSEGDGYPAGYHDFKLADFQLLKSLGYAIRWARESKDDRRADRYRAAGDRILGRLLRVQLGPEYGPAFEGNWNESEPIADPVEGSPPAMSEARVQVDPTRCPYQIRPLGASAAMRCLPIYLSGREA